MIGDIEAFRAELQTHALSQRERFLERDIPGRDSGRDAGIAAEVPQLPRAREAKAGFRVNVARTFRSAAGLIGLAQNHPGDGDARFGVRSDIGETHRRQDRGDSRGEGERRAIFQGNDPAELPSAQDVPHDPPPVQQRLARSKGQRVDVVELQDVAGIPGSERLVGVNVGRIEEIAGGAVEGELGPRGLLRRGNGF